MGGPYPHEGKCQRGYYYLVTAAVRRRRAGLAPAGFQRARNPQHFVTNFRDTSTTSTALVLPFFRIRRPTVRGTHRRLSTASNFFNRYGSALSPSTREGLSEPLNPTEADSTAPDPMQKDQEGNHVCARELQAFFFLLIAGYSCFVGTLLAIFVPQGCGTFQNEGANSTLTYSQSDCTIDQNVYQDITPFNAFVLFVNFFTAAALAYGFYVEFTRERFILERFDVDDAKPDDYLYTMELNKDQHPENTKLAEALLAINRRYYNTVVFLSVLYLFNALVSAVLVFYFYYQDYVSLLLLFWGLYRTRCSIPPPFSPLFRPHNARTTTPHLPCPPARRGRSQRTLPASSLSPPGWGTLSRLQRSAWSL